MRAEARAQPRREGRDDSMMSAIGRRRSAVVERAVAEHELEVLRDEEHHAVHGDEDEDHPARSRAECRVAEVVHVEHRLARCRSQATNPARTTTAKPSAASVSTLPHPFSGASISPYTSATIPTMERSAPIGSRLASSGSRDLGTRNFPGDQRHEDDRDVHEEHRPVPEVAEQVAARERSEGTCRAGDARPDRDRLRPLVRGEDVDDDRQRRRHDQRSRRAHHARGCRSAATSRVDSVASTAPNRKSTSPICSAPLRPKRSPSAPVVKRSPAKTRE